MLYFFKFLKKKKIKKKDVLFMDSSTIQFILFLGIK